MQLEKLSTRPKTSKLTIDDTSAWLTKHGNGMARLPKRETKDIKGSYWNQYGTQPLQKIIDDWFLTNDSLIPFEIPHPICCNYVRKACDHMVEAGELVKSTVKRPYDDPIKGKIIKNYVIYKKA